MAAEANLMERLTALCKRRGFIFPGSEIYGGLSGFWDYGPLGVELKRNIKDAWWRDMVLDPPDGVDGRQVVMQGLDCAIIMNPRVWEASGHVGGFSDPMVDCKECKGRFRADQVLVFDAYLGDHYLTTNSAEIDDANNALYANLVDYLASPKNTISDPAIRSFVKALRKEYTNAVLADEQLTQAIASASGGSVSREEVPELLKKAGLNLRFSKLTEVASRPEGIACPTCGAKKSLTEPREFNLMFETHTGALQADSSKCYLRPETAQGIFVNFPNVLDTSRVKLPFGIAQVGKSFRNEINPRNYTFRSREFEQMEIEFFCHPDTAMDWYEFWRNVRYNWYVNLGIKSEKLRLRDQVGDELAHYSKACADIEYLFPFSDEHQELEGVAHRGCYDLTKHQEHSGKDLTYFDDDLWQADAHKYKEDKKAAKQAKSGMPYRFLPTVIEPSAGADRATLAFLCEAYTEDEAPNDKGKLDKRIVMKFHPKIAPIKAAFFPLVNKEGMPEVANKLYREAKRRMNVFYDDKGAIGRRYRRQDEAGTPFCVTVDGDTLESGTVTIRDRDSLQQERVGVEHVVTWLTEKME